MLLSLHFSSARAPVIKFEIVDAPSSEMSTKSLILFAYINSTLALKQICLRLI